MSLEVVSGSAECPSCFEEISVEDVMQNEIIQCPECGGDLEVIEIDPLQLDMAPEEDEDWGE